jgi:hypothetical protein
VSALLKWVLIVIFVLYIALAFWSSGTGQPDPDPHAPIDVLPMTFAHKDHIKQNCVVCHHNYNDDTGNGLCIDCHLRDPEVSHIVEEQFHDLCMSCHAEKHLEGEKGGPLRRCVDCHVEDHLP